LTFQTAFRTIQMNRQTGASLVSEVLDSLDDALIFGTDPPQTFILLAHDCSFTTGVEALYISVSNHIELKSKGSEPAMALLHEIGHALDHQSDGSSASNSKFNTWKIAIQDSPCLLRLEENIVDGYLPEYAQKTRELFARSFEQWCATHVLENDNVRSEWQRQVSTHRSVERGLYWSPEEFTIIAEAIEYDLENFGVLTRKK
jgi:hypothetical protein